MFMCIYRPPKQDSQYFLEHLSLIIDHYSSIYDNHIIFGILTWNLKILN